MAFNKKLLIALAFLGPYVVAQTKVHPSEWENFHFANQLRANGFTCSDGTYFKPNPQPLVFDCALWRASYLHSKDMKDRGYFGHEDPDGKGPWVRAPSAYGENIAHTEVGTFSGPMAQAALDMFKN